MRPAPSSLLRELLAGPKTAAELAQALRLSQPGFSRLFKSASGIERVRSFGAGRATIYDLEHPAWVEAVTKKP